MKTRFFPLIVLSLLAFMGCEQQVSETVTYVINEPIVMEASVFRNSVKVSKAPHELTGYGKMSYYNGYLFMSDPEKGIHIIDNRNPSNPQLVAYIELLGNADLSVRNNILYADSYVDLVWFDITDPANPELKGRLENAFMGVLPAVTNTSAIDQKLCEEELQNNKIIVGWKEVTRTEEVEDYWSRGGFWGWVRNGLTSPGGKDFVEAGAAASGNSINGSMSRFVIYKDYLYSVMHSQIMIFDLSGTAPVQAADKVYTSWDVETIFSYGDYMYLGTPGGMIIYSVEDPLKPEALSAIMHVYGCDPVVVEDDVAYVTIHSGNACGPDSDELILIDVKDKRNPKQIMSYDMTHPKGLGIDNKTLFVCDEGLKIFDANYPLDLLSHQLAHYTGMAGYDVIPFNTTLMMIAEEGIYQYDYSQLNAIRQLSFLPVKAE